MCKKQKKRVFVDLAGYMNPPRFRSIEKRYIIKNIKAKALAEEVIF